MGSEIKMVP